MQRVLGIVVAVLLAAGVVGVVRERRTTHATTAPTTTPAAGGASTVIVLRPDQLRVTGTVQRATFDGASAPPLRLPLTITAGSRGATRARITGARQAGADVTITWDGGQPLPVSGTGGLDVVGAHLDVAPDGLTWALDGDPRALLPGHYQLGATVAVGTSGLATPRDGTAFDAGPSCQLTTVNGALVHVTPEPLHLVGPGQFELHGRLQVETAGGTVPASAVHFGPGSFVVDLAPSGGNWSVQVLAEGAFTRSS